MSESAPGLSQRYRPAATNRPPEAATRWGETLQRTVAGLLCATVSLPSVLVTVMTAKIRKNAITALRKVITPARIVRLKPQLTRWG
ncbi:hypothetical protein [Dactylosporangium sucinum]|uniref:Uncharacterized protein n=1 Tax=Dactylosporangium sucinum TaxID=1424081 RepID=A0A917TCY2_9ACTN|nr:hypothetical protein [Dactylosporangium sucinum]GGM18636.1 hypothetical protein GCM10007977_019930 [Dactylosporangium sucinum]